MAKARSPGYPAIGLSTAIEKITAVYNKDVQNSIPREVVAKHAGYAGINGNSLAMLSSLIKFGLLTGRGDNSAVSDLALAIIAHPPGSQERLEAIKEAAYGPALFAEIRDKFEGRKVSDEALRSYLLTQKFLPSAVDGVIRSYRETMSLVEAESRGYGDGTPSGMDLPVKSEGNPASRTRIVETQSDFMEFQAQFKAAEAAAKTAAETFQIVMMGDGRIIVSGTIKDKVQADMAIKILQMGKEILPAGQQPAREPRAGESEEADSKIV